MIKRSAGTMIAIDVEFDAVIVRVTTLALAMSGTRFEKNELHEQVRLIDQKMQRIHAELSIIQEEFRELGPKDGLQDKLRSEE